MTRVYFIACGGRIKVGMSKDVPRRITSIAAYLDGPIELLGNIAVASSAFQQRRSQWRR